MRKPGSLVGMVAFLAVCLAGLMVLRMTLGGRAEMPGAFAARHSLPEALAESAASGRPVLALATADWCGPCQALKRGALADERLSRWIEDHTVPVSVDLTNERDPAAQEAAQALQVRSIPALVLLDGGRIVARREGVAGADAILAWLQEAAPAAVTRED